MKVFDLTGREVLSKEGENSVAIVMDAALNNGIYIVDVITENNHYSTKIAK